MLVLYAEDDIDDFGIFCEVLQTINPLVKCVNARNGFDVLEFLDNSTTLPQYVFLDINMPAMDGKACLKHIKKDERFKLIPVIIYTTSKNPKDIELCKQLGAADYLIKPNTVKEAFDKLSKFFK
jgi:CheY-like chemotaxis protein